MKSRLRPPQSRTSSYQNDADVSKRRSLLPQPGQTRHTSHLPDATPSRQETKFQPAVVARPRPKSMYQNGTSFSQLRETNEKSTVSRSIRPPNSISKPSEPQIAGLDQTRSLRRPNAPAQPVATTRTISHARAQSTSNVTSSRRDATNTKLILPKSQLTAPSTSTKPQTVHGDAQTAVPRASARLAGLSRTDSIKIRSELPGGGLTAQSASRPEDPTAMPPRRREVTKEEHTKTARPAFSTLQQHFTPRKTGKAPTSTFLHPAPVPDARSLPPEIISLQSVLLQLHLLHTKSAEVSRRWQVSAKRSLHKKFEEVASLHQAMLDYERAGQEQKNLQALLEWTAGTSSTKLIEYIKVLSGPLHELPVLVEPGGRFQRLIDDFENWILRVEKTWSARLSTSIGHDGPESIESLGDSWKAENTALIRKVISYSRELEHAGQPASESSIACIIATCKTLLKGLSDELNIMQEIEAEVAIREKEWVAARFQAIARDVDSYSLQADSETAAWRM
ncbi:hypothetical protein EK21DRAFT_56635 [Setomelanomma holmii]|uniref:Uncharacterized protein n=1 Tax=Setomelanomma holmii TaxID=210430 RepID=A0A9P4HHG8_9PLEO|nr:hypothetical protein EK21DRAFT_56635 [Setomelanomma holmii]